MVLLNDYAKREIVPTDEVEKLKVQCTMYEPSSYDPYTDTLRPMWHPEGCSRTGMVDIDDVGGWFWVDEFAFCPSCAVLWKKRYGDTNELITLMEGA